MKNTELRFKVKDGIIFCAQKGSAEVAICQYEQETLKVSIWYDYSPVPLMLTACAKAGDAARVILLPYRIELYVNDALCDEEWPCGNCRLDGAETVGDVSVLSFEETAQQEPDVLYTFRSAEGWKPEKTVFVGDCMPYVSDGRYHVLYLKDRHHHASKWGKGAHQWAHISTSDFDTWQAHPLAVEIDDPNEGSICTGSHIEKDGVHMLFYTVRTCDGSPAPIRRSISLDGTHFTKDASFSFILSKAYTGASARDPKIVRAYDGTYHMFVTTTQVSSGKGCLAHLSSSDLDNWKEEPQPIYVAPDEHEPECPDYIALNGRYYLIFSLRSVGQYLYSDEPFSGWKRPENPAIPCKSVPKCAIWQDGLVFAGFDGNGRYGGTLTFARATADEKGELVF